MGSAVLKIEDEEEKYALVGKNRRYLGQESNSDQIFEENLNKRDRKRS
jgi:hypothetical protein